MENSKDRSNFKVYGNIKLINEFIVGFEYNCMQTLHPLALANDKKPEYYHRMVFIKSIEDENYVVSHHFEHDGKEIVFDDDFVNNSKFFDNSVVIVLCDKQSGEECLKDDFMNRRRDHVEGVIYTPSLEENDY